jgi:creatinine amidohydrolase/Fe(II)-dependent formamide hydrolase-like protein
VCLAPIATTTPTTYRDDSRPDVHARGSGRAVQRRLGGPGDDRPRPRVDPIRKIDLLAVAAIEQHGPHLPLATDELINEGVVAAALRRLPSTALVLVLPALNVGDSLEHSAFLGTLCAHLDTMMGLLLAMGRGVARRGPKRMVLFNSHGGHCAHVDLAALNTPTLA